MLSLEFQSARFSKFAFVLFRYITNHLMTNPFANSKLCFQRPKFDSVNIDFLGKQNSLFPLGPVDAIENIVTNTVIAT